jgi:S1-C subfamily serine protease
VSSIANNVSPGLVDINTTIDFGQGEAAGTGQVLTSSGEVLTNNHVINGATSISVTDVGNGKTYSASVVGYDRSQDVAVIQLKNASGLQTVNLGDSSNLSVGQAVVGLGNAGGTGGTPSAAGGSVTALNQSITASDEMDGTSEQLTGLIQTNANIQAGDSGGPLVNTSGQVVGMDTAASDTYTFQGGSGSGSEGFAIPINTASSIAKQIEAGSTSSSIHLGDTGFLGVEVSGSSSGANGGGSFGSGSSSGGGSQSTNGVAIQGAVANTPAANAGLGQGDVITSVNGVSVNSANDLTNELGKFHPGDKVTVNWTDSSGQQHTSTVTLAPGPAA